MRKQGRIIAEIMLRDFPNIDKYIESRTEEVKYPVSSRDENVGGGKSSKISKPQEELIITIDSDRRLGSLEKEKAAVDKALSQCDDITYKIVEQLFLTKRRIKTIDGITEDVHLSRSNIYRRLNQLYVDILKNRGLYEFV